MLDFPLHTIHDLYNLTVIINIILIILQVQLDVKVWFVQDQLKGNDTTEIRVKFIKKLEDAVPTGED